jgi:hypothetical protein
MNVRRWLRACGNSISAAEGEVAGRIDQVRCVELALTERRGRKKPLRSSAGSHLHRLHHSGNPRYIQDALEVVGQHLKVHCGAHPPASGSGNGRPPSNASACRRLVRQCFFGWSLHRLPVESTLHNFQYMFVLPSSDAAIVAGRTSLLEMPARACAGPVHAQIHVFLNGFESKNCALTGGASILTTSCNVDEVAFGEDPFLP